MKVLYRVLVVTFIVTIVAGIVAGISYFQAMFHLLQTMPGGTQALGQVSDDEVLRMGPSPEEIINIFFSPILLISAMLALLAGLANTIIGIIITVSNTSMRSQNRVFWILGFILFGFITNIVFFALKNSNNLLDEKRFDPNADSLTQSY